MAATKQPFSAWGVLPDRRGNGFGRLLIRQATGHCSGEGVRSIYCDTALNNDTMIHLCESEGWTRLPLHERPFGWR